MSWDDNWVRAVVGIGVAALGAIIAGVVNAYAAKLKIKEIELNYRYKLRDGYLDNARKLTGEVYIPISVALTNLLKGYERPQTRRHPISMLSRRQMTNFVTAAGTISQH
jgi:ABC-type uncharacterized transport system ATPase subunit